ncbi:MAG: hypothetical protein ABEI39_04750 [Halobacteriales archaeon]
MQFGVSISIVLLLVVGAGALAPVGAATPGENATSTGADGAPATTVEPGEVAAGEDPATTERAPETTVSVARSADGRVDYTLNISSVPASERLWVVLRGPVTVVSSSGFDRASGDGVTRLSLREDRPGPVSVTVATARDPASSRDAAATSAWTFGQVPFVELQWAANGSIGRSWPLSEVRTPDSGAPAVVGDRYALVGDFETVRRTTPHGSLALVAPAGVLTDAERERVGDALARAARDLDVGDRDERALAFAAPGSVRWGGESVPARDEFWVNADSALDHPEAVWLHEYVHTRQSFRLARDMRWFREASAEYYAAQLAREQGLVDRPAVERHLDGEPSRATLTDPGTWSGSQVPHRKGARVLAVLDRRIREQTYGHRSLEDVFRRLNRHDGVVTYDVFAQTVAEVTGEPGDAWLDRHVAGSAPVAPRYGTDARTVGALALGGLGIGEAPAGPGVASSQAAGVLAGVRGDGVAFFLLATAFSVVASVPLYGALARRERRDDERDGAETDDRRARLS